MTRAPGQVAPWARWIVKRILGPWARVSFRPTITGLDTLPKDGPFMLVANHSAGMGMAEIGSFAVLYSQHCEQHDREPRIAGFAHHVAHRLFPLSVLLQGLGTVPSTYEAAYAALESGAPLLVFPGGEYETLRPIWQAHRVDLGGRRGFLRIAKKVGVPIVPLGIRGSHFTTPMLLRAGWLAWLLILPRMFGFKRWGITLLGAVVATGAFLSTWTWPARVLVAWVALWFPATFIPVIPWTIRMKVGEALHPDALFDDDDPELHGALDRVQSRIQGLVDELGR